MTAQLCPHCGTPNRSGSNFCNRCGAALTVDLQRAPPAESAPSPGSDAPPEYRSDQPWLEPGFVGEDDVPFQDEEDLAALDDLAPMPAPAARLVSGVQGLLDPIRVATIPTEQAAAPTSPAPAEPPFPAEQLRRVRALMTEEQLIASAAQSPAPAERSLWLPWIFVLLGRGVIAPLLFGWSLPARAPALWPGVETAFATVEALESGAHVQILWAYDPATAGELDLVSAPVLRHLLDRQPTLEVVSLLPNGPATAQRLLAGVERERLSDLAVVGAHRTVEVRFLPGGATVLPLLATQPADLAIIFAAQAEDVQHWLEQVAPVNRAPVLAVTAAGADPPLRPDLDSGQLVGLVSGFDGAYHYGELLGRRSAPDEVRNLRLQIAGQTYGALTIVAIIVLGNLAVLLVGRRHDG
ncbi:MAG: zinc ribbon domain-containing protein [Caldilinea sp.]